MTQTSMPSDPIGIPSTPLVIWSTPQSHGRPLRHDAVRGTLWAIGEYGVSQVLRLGANLILTRLLFPDAFGLMTLVNVFMQGITMLSDIGLRGSVIQNRRGDDPDFLATIWTIQVTRGILLTFFAALLSWPVARFYGQPSLAWLLSVAGLTALFTGLRSTAIFTCDRHLHIDRLAKLNVLSSIGGILVMIGWAYFMPSVWALIAGGLVGSFTSMILSHLILPGGALEFRLDKESFREIARFGKWIFISTALTFLASRADRLVFGKVITVSQLGVFGIALMFAGLPMEIVTKIGSQVAFPAYSKMLASSGYFPGVFRQTRLLLLLAGAAMISTLIAVGPSLIHTLYDSRYWDAGWMVSLLALGSWVQILETTNGAALLAMGKPKWIAAGNAAKVLGMAVLIPVGFWQGGFEGGIIGVVVAEVPKYLVVARATARYGFAQGGVDILMSGALALAAGLAFYVAHRIVVSDDDLTMAGISCGVIMLIWIFPLIWCIRQNERAAQHSRSLATTECVSHS